MKSTFFFMNLVRTRPETRGFIFVLLNEITDLALGNGDMHADVRQIVERDDVPRAHANATEARRSADEALFRRAVNVNAPIARTAFLLFHPSQPDYTRHNRVPARRIRVDDLAGRHPILDHRTGRQVITELRRDK